MTTTQQYSLVLYSLGCISLNTPYHTAALYSIYLKNKLPVDAIFAVTVQLDQILAANTIYLPQVIILDPDATWGA